MATHPRAEMTADMSPGEARVRCPEDALFKQIQARAYTLFEARGRGPGRALDDWLQAEREMRRTAGEGGGAHGPLSTAWITLR